MSGGCLGFLPSTVWVIMYLAAVKIMVPEGPIQIFSPSENAFAKTTQISSTVPGT